MRRARVFCSLGFGLMLVTTTAVADVNGRPSWLPNPKLTPGAVRREQHRGDLRARHDRAHRVWHDKAGTLARYRIAPSDAALYEDDDLIPVCLGGDNASPLNHWLQPLGGEWGAEKKDMLERQLCTAICLSRDNGQLARYQAAFARDWTTLWRQTFR